MAAVNRYGEHMELARRNIDQALATISAEVGDDGAAQLAELRTLSAPRLGWRTVALVAACTPIFAAVAVAAFLLFGLPAAIATTAVGPVVYVFATRRQKLGHDRRAQRRQELVAELQAICEGRRAA